MNLFTNLQFCNIITDTDEDYKFYNSKFGLSGVSVIKKLDITDHSNERNSIFITDNPLPDYNYELAPSIISNKEKSEFLVNNFIHKHAYLYQPYIKISYDAILDGDLDSFLKRELDETNWRYFYFFEKACYLFSGRKLIVLSLESLKFLGLNVKQIISSLLSFDQTICFSYENIRKYLISDFKNNIITIENILWSRFNDVRFMSNSLEDNFYYAFAGVKVIHQISYLMYYILEFNPLTIEEELSSKRFYQKDIITNWLNSSKIYFKTNNIKNLEFKNDENGYFIQTHYSNKRTITGRINCDNSNFNPQMLPKLSPLRENVVSKYKNGKIVVYDYVSFESKLSIYATGNEEFIEKMKDKDIHEECAKILFDTSIINEESRKIGKIFNHTLLYGGGIEKLKSITYHHVDKLKNFEEIISDVKSMLQPIFDKSQEIVDMYKSYGYIINPFYVLVRPKKEWAVFNNFIQSTAADIVVNKLFDLKQYLKDKNISFLYQVHDSFILDFSPDELNRIDEIKDLLSSVNKVKFPIHYKIGKTLLECNL